MQINVRGRGRIGVSLVASMAVLGVGAASTVSPASSAPPVEDCAAAYPMDDLRADLDASLDGTLPVEGDTVTRGTVPTHFTGDVLGILDDGIAPGLDMVMVRIDVAAMGAPGVEGIWAGMSGSPVYTEGGDLIGAVAYGLTWGESDVAGVTPFEEMDNYLPGAGATTVAVSDRAARTIADGSRVTRAQAAQGFSQLRIPRRVAGLSAARVAELRSHAEFRDSEYLVKKLGGVGGSIASAASAAEDVVAGGNLAAAASFGDITMGGVGTATSVCDGSVVGFGHPFNFLGTTSLTLHPANAIYIQDDPMGVPFKVANLGDPVGTISGDHLSGISGTFGAVPDLTDITSRVAYHGRERTGGSSVSVPDANASVTFYQQLANHDRVLDGIVPGTEQLTWEIHGTEGGVPFELGASDVYTSEYDIAYESPWEVADLVWMLSAFPGVVITDVATDAEVTDDTTSWRIRLLESKVDGSWEKVSRRHTLMVDAGSTLKLRATLESSEGGTTVVPLGIDVPAKAAGKRGWLSVEGGAWQYTDVYGADNVAEIEEALADAVQNDQVVAWLGTNSGEPFERKQTASEGTGQVVHGGKHADVKFR